IETVDLEKHQPFPQADLEGKIVDARLQAGVIAAADVEVIVHSLTLADPALDPGFGACAVALHPRSAQVAEVAARLELEDRAGKIGRTRQRGAVVSRAELVCRRSEVLPDSGRRLRREAFAAGRACDVVLDRDVEPVFLDLHAAAPAPCATYVVIL